MPHSTSEPPPERTRPSGSVVADLKWIRARIRGVLLVNRLLAIAALLLAASIVLGLTDFLVRLPLWLRWLHWTVGLIAFAYLLWRYVRPVWRFSPSLTDLALRIERERPQVRGLLATAIDFEREGDASRSPSATPRLSSGLARAVLRRAEIAWGSSSAAGLIKPRATIRLASACFAAAAIAAVLFIVSPTLTSIGALRLAAPWTNAAWPKRTGVADMTDGSVHARGTALPLQAAVIKSNRSWDSTYVAVRYRLINGEETGPDRRELLTWQEREVETPYAVPGALFERLIEPAADAVEFRFETEDDSTEWRRIRLVPPPAVIGATALITPPAYARQLLAAENQSKSRAEPVSADLGPGTDDRAVAPPSLAGSEVELVITLNKPVEMPEAVAEQFVDPETPIDAPGRARITRRGETWTIRWTLAESLRLPIRLRDEFGIESIDEAVFRFEALTDRPAAATIVDPASDRTVLPTAVVPITAEGRDDVGLSWVALEQTLWTPAGEPGAKSPPGGALEQRGEPIESARLESVGRTIARTSIELDLTPFDLKPGDELRLAALAIDVRAAETDGALPTRSAPRTLRVISEAQFVEEVQRTLAEVRQAAIRADEQQEGLRTQTQSGRADATVRRGQGAVSERLAKQSETVQRLIDRVSENRVEDRGLEELLARAKSTINDAGQASGRAAQSLEQAAANRAGESPEQGAQPGEQSSPSSPRQPGESQSGKPSPAQPSQDAPQSGQPSSPSSDSPSQSTGQPQQGEPSPTPQGQPSSPQSGEPSPSQQGKQPQGAPQQQQQQQQQDQPADEQPQTSDPDLRQAAEAQQEVQDDLRSLIELLDRGEDNWLARNTIERLLREQKELRDKTQQTGRETAGKTSEQLTPQQRTELDAIVEKQTQLADQTGDLARDMREREKNLKEKDPAAAQGMAQAARRAEQSQVAQTMRNAASEAQQNQTARASRQQQQAEEALEEMLEDLNRVDKARDEVLRRELASIIESLESLILQNEAEIAALDEVIRAKKSLDGLDAGVIRLNQNTLGALDQIKAAGPDAAPIGTLVSRAADAQAGAITEIRRPVVGATMVRDYEGRSLLLLKQALEKARQIDQAAADRERRKKLAELKKIYREILERQVGVRDETLPMAEIADLSRRDRQLARALAERQETIGADLKQMLTQTKELQEAKVFDYAHVRMDTLSRAAAGALSDAKIPPSLSSQASLITTLKNVLEALNDPKPDEKKFAEGATGGEGGGGQGSGEGALLPPVKELMLLRQMQTDLAQQTIESNAVEGGPPREMLQNLGKAQRELMNVGREFVDRMKQQGSPAAPPMEPPAPENPAPEPEAPKEDSPDAP